MLKLSARLVRTQINLRWIGTDSRLIQGSLTMRFHEYLNKTSDDQRVKSKAEQLLHETIPSNDHHAIKRIDRECMKELQNQLSAEEILKCFEYITHFLPNQVCNFNFFEEALRTLLEDKLTCQKEFVRLCYYIGFLKKNHPGPKYLRGLLEKQLEPALAACDRLTRTDLAILSISCYKTSVRVSSKRFHERIVQEILETSDNDSFILVALIKSLKHNQIYSDQVLAKIGEIIRQSDFGYEPLVHILPYITEHGSNNDSLIELICEKSIKSFDEQSRAKDIQKFLHSCALLNLKMKREVLEELERLVLERTKGEEFGIRFDHFVNAALSLWILNHHSHQLVTKLLSDERFYKTGPYSRIKLDSRMKLLQTCVEIEQPEWIKNGNFKMMSFNASRSAPNYLIKSSLERVMNINVNDKEAKFVQQIMNLNIAGILSTDNNGKVTHYEVLDEQTSLADNTTPNGIFQLKLRLLKKKNCHYQIVSVLQ
jgi:hypothetical protein